MCSYLMYVCMYVICLYVIVYEIKLGMGGEGGIEKGEGMGERK